jgi:hypothetical protein
MQHQETLATQRKDQVQAPFENRQRLCNRHVFVRRTPVHAESNQAPIKTGRRSSLLQTSVKAIHAILRQQRIIFVEAIQGLREAAYIGTDQCSEWSDLYTEPGPAEKAAKLIQRQARN